MNVFDLDIDVPEDEEANSEEFVIWPARLNQNLPPDCLWMVFVAEHFYDERDNAEDAPQKFYTWMMLADPVLGEDHIKRHLTSSGKNSSVHVLTCLHISHVLRAFQHIEQIVPLQASAILGPMETLDTMAQKKFVVWSTTAQNLSDYDPTARMNFWIVQAAGPGAASLAVIAKSGGDQICAVCETAEFEKLAKQMNSVAVNEKFDEIYADVRQTDQALTSRDLAILSQKSLRHAILKEWAHYVKEYGVDYLSGPGPLA